MCALHITIEVKAFNGLPVPIEKKKQKKMKSENNEQNECLELGKWLWKDSFCYHCLSHEKW